MEVTRTTADTTETAGLYLVALIDILGQGERLSQVPWPLSPGADPREAAKAYKSCIDEIHDLRSSISKYYENFSASLRESKLDPASRPRLILQMFADTVIAYVQLTYDNSSVVGTLAALGACAFTALASLAKGYAIRGGLDVGVGNETDGREVYGPVAASAHYLESKVSAFPRIVVGEGLRRYLDVVEQPTPGHAPSSISVNSIALCRGFLTDDVDGAAIVDYLGQTCLETMAKGRETACGAYEYVLGQYLRFRKEGNRRLALRYSLLLRYFESRSALWKMTENAESTGG